MKQAFSQSWYSKLSVVLLCLLLLQAFSMQDRLTGQVIPEPVVPEKEDTVKLPKPVPKPFIGIVMTDAGGDSGVLVSSVVKGAPAELAGLKANDVIVKFGNAQVSNLDQIRAQVKTYSICLLYTSPSPRDATLSRMPSSA